MSVASPTTYRDQVNSSLTPSLPATSAMTPGINGLLSHFQPIVTSQKLRSHSPIPSTSDVQLQEPSLKRHYSSQDLTHHLEGQTNKKTCFLPVGISTNSNEMTQTSSESTITLSASSQTQTQTLPGSQLHSDSHSQPQPQSMTQSNESYDALTRKSCSVSDVSSPKITLPSLNDALAATEPKLNQPPTVSQDYFDTYKPHDENWRYGLLDTIRKTDDRSFLLTQTSATKPKLPSIQELNSRERPLFDSRVGHKGLPGFSVRKVNFPYESNYTYLNQTYMKDVERYPEYLELAQSLVLLSRPQPQTSPLVYAYNNLRNRNPGLRIQTPAFGNHAQHPQLPPHSQSFAYAQDAQVSKAMVHHGLPTPQLSSFNSTNVAAHNGVQGYISSPISAGLPSISQIAYGTPDNSFELKATTPSDSDKMNTIGNNAHPSSANARTRFIPITPPTVKNKTRSELMKSPSSRSAPSCPRVCISCGSDLSPCWRPSWSPKEGQLCNSCGLRYKKTSARCLNHLCRKIPAKGEWASMVSKGMALYDGVQAYSCLGCGYKVETK